MNILSSHTPLVSVIVPCYNHAPYLKERIESVLGQDYPTFEVILLDDCSPDDTAQILRSYERYPRVSHVVINEVNSGNTFVQWQRGMELAQGDYVWIAESDDVAEPSFLTRLMAQLTARQDAVLAFSGSRMIGPDSQDLGYSWDEPQRFRNDGVYEGTEFCLHRLVQKNLLYNASMIVFRKSCYKEVDDRYRQFRNSGDWLFWFEICRQGMVCEVPDKLNGFRQHPKKVSNAARTSGKDFEEMAGVQCLILEKLHLGGWARRSLRGRQTKRLMKSVVADKQRLRDAFPEVYGGTILDTLVYSLDKWLNLSGIQR